MDLIRVKNLAAWHHKSENSIARVILVHGISEHSGRHLNTVKALTDNQVEVVRFDLRGSGHSDGQKQYVDSFSDYVQDVETIFEWQKNNLPAKPLFLLGHSLGGAVSFHFFPKYQDEFKGFITTAPAYRTGPGVSPLLIRVGKILVKFAPKMYLPAIRNKGVLSHDPRIEEEYYNDPYAYHNNTLRQGNEILEALEKMPAMAAQIHQPVFIAHGTADKIVIASGSFELFVKLKSDFKELHYFPDGYHELHNDTAQGEYFRMILDWTRRILAL